MKQINAPQGSPEWHASRATTWNASDAPAMMGCDPNRTRTQLIQELATGIQREFSDFVQDRIIDEGHRFEALARPLAEEIIGESLYPVSATHDTLVIGGRPVAASFDGVTLLENALFEHKRLNAALRYTPWDEGNGDHLPAHYRIQMEHQLLVSGADCVLFMASEWDADGNLVEKRHCWYNSDPALRAQIIAGWKQLAEDLAAWKPSDKPATAVLVASPVEALPAVSVKVDGSLVVRQNFPAFEVALRDFLDNRLIRKPQTDQDFADLDQQIKALKAAEEALAAAEAQMLAQVAEIDSAKKTKDMLAKLVRDNRLMAEKLLAAEKDRRKLEIVQAGRDALAAHIAACNQRLGKPLMPNIAADFAGAIKGMRSLASMEDAISTMLAKAKIEASATADRIEMNLRYLRENAGEFRALFADTPTIVLKAPDDLQALVTARISEHKAAIQKQAEEAAERERERIRREEQAAAEARAREAEAARAPVQSEASAAPDQQPSESLLNPQAAWPFPNKPTEPVQAANVVQIRPPAAPPADDSARIKLGELNALIAPLSVTADGLAELGFKQLPNTGPAKLYRAADRDLILKAMVDHINRVRDTAPMAA